MSADEWMLVPREPTHKMLVAASEAAVANRDYSRAEYPMPRTRAIWDAALAAAPSPPAQPQEGGDEHTNVGPRKNRASDNTQPQADTSSPGAQAPLPELAISADRIEQLREYLYTPGVRAREVDDILDTALAAHAYKAAWMKAEAAWRAERAAREEAERYAAENGLGWKALYDKAIAQRDEALAAQKRAEEERDRADNAIARIGSYVGTTDEWTDQDNMIVDVDRAVARLTAENAALKAERDQLIYLNDQGGVDQSLTPTLNEYNMLCDNIHALKRENVALRKSLDGAREALDAVLNSARIPVGASDGCGTVAVTAPSAAAIALCIAAIEPLRDGIQDPGFEDGQRSADIEDALNVLRSLPIEPTNKDPQP